MNMKNKEELIRLITKDRADVALESIIDATLGKTDLAPEAIIQLARYRELQKSKNQNIIPIDNFNVEKAKIIKSTISLVESFSSLKEPDPIENDGLNRDYSTKIIGVWGGMNLNMKDMKSAYFYWTFLPNGKSTFLAMEEKSGKILYSHSGIWGCSSKSIHELYTDNSTSICDLTWINDNKFRIKVLNYSKFPNASIEREYEKII